MKKNKATPNHYTTISKCRVCGSRRLIEVINIPPQFIASTFVETNDSNPKSRIKIPMTALLCKKCGLVQLAETVSPDLLYEQYFYRSSISNTMNKDLRSFTPRRWKSTCTLGGDSCCGRWTMLDPL